MMNDLCEEKREFCEEINPNIFQKVKADYFSHTFKIKDNQSLNYYNEIEQYIS